MKTSDVSGAYYRVYFNLPWNKDEHTWETGIDYEAAQFAELVKAYRVEYISYKEKKWRVVEKVDVSSIKH